MKKADFLLLGLLCLLGVGMFVMVLCCYKDDAIETGSWGLHFTGEGETPDAPVSQEELEKLETAFIGDTGEKVLYLTFDAGYENGFTPAILDVLKKHDVKAAFFLVGHYIDTNPDLVRRMVREGHIVGNHTNTHCDMSKISNLTSFRNELETLEAKYQEATGEEMQKFYRPPQGVYSEDNLKMAQQLGYKTVFWSLAYVDWNVDDQPDPEKAIQTILSRTHPGAVVLLHSTSETNAMILDELLTQWENLGYRFGTPADQLRFKKNHKKHLTKWHGHGMIQRLMVRIRPAGVVQW